MERIGKVFSMKSTDNNGTRTVEGFVRSKKLRNIVNSIDFLGCVTEKLRNEENAMNAVNAYNGKLNDKKEISWGLLLNYDETRAMTYFRYLFEIGKAPETVTPETKDDGEVVPEVHAAEPVGEVVPEKVEVEKKETEKKETKDKGPKGPKGTKTKKDPKKKETAKGQAEKPAPAVLGEKGTDKPSIAAKISRYARGVENFLRKQGLWIESTRWIYSPAMAATMYC